MAFVEIGQRNKALIRKPDGYLGLGDPVLNPWFQTWMGDQSVALFSTVGSFTQPSHVSNQGITQLISMWFREMKPDHVLEFGSGIGNLTFPALSSAGTQVLATDIDEKALAGLELSLEKTGLQNRVQIRRGDFRKHAPDIKKADVLLLNPARSGVGRFLEELLPLRPEFIIYMSCYPESFSRDIATLHDYKLEEIHLMDQFPGTRHMEVLAKFKRKN